MSAHKRCCKQPGHTALNGTSKVTGQLDLGGHAGCSHQITAQWMSIESVKLMRISTRLFELAYSETMGTRLLITF